VKHVLLLVALGLALWVLSNNFKLTIQVVPPPKTKPDPVAMEAPPTPVSIPAPTPTPASLTANDPMAPAADIFHRHHSMNDIDNTSSDRTNQPSVDNH
jgi:hypothetical protein